MGAVVGDRSALPAPRAGRCRAGPRCPCRPAARSHQGAAALGPAPCSEVTAARGPHPWAGGRRRERGRLRSGPVRAPRGCRAAGGSRGVMGARVCCDRARGQRGQPCPGGFAGV